MQKFDVHSNHNHRCSTLIFHKYGLNQSQIDDYYKRLDILRNTIHPDPYKKANSPREYYVKCADGTPIFMQAWIPKDPKGLILCQHGNSVHSDLFYPLADHIVPKGWALIATDNCGHGRSGPMRGFMGHTVLMNGIYASIIRSWRKKYPNAPITFIGESLGCIMVSEYGNSTIGKQYPIDAIIFMVPPLNVPILHSLIPIRGLIKLLFIPILTFLSPLIDRKPLLYFNGFAPQVTYLDAFEQYDEKDPLVNSFIFLGNIKQLALMMFDFKDKLSAITQPTLILQGTGDTILNYIGAQEVYDTIRSEQKKLKFYLKSNHSLFMDKHSQAIYDDILHFVENIRKGREN